MQVVLVQCNYLKNVNVSVFVEWLTKVPLKVFRLTQ